MEISQDAVKATKLARSHGVKIILVSGRVSKFLIEINKRYDIADVIVAENGALLFFQKDGKKVPTSNYDINLKKLIGNIDFPIEYGEVIASVKVEYEKRILEIIRNKKISVRLIHNVDSTMLLPPDVDKGAGILKALKILEIDKKNLAVIGDGENDMEMFSVAGTRVAVANAVDILKKNADIVCKNSYGDGVAEFIEMILGKR